MTQEEKKERQKLHAKKYYTSPKGRKKRYELRQRYYGRTQDLSDGYKRRWTSDEVELLCNFKGSDDELAWRLNRSVASIQAKRHRINAGE
jgi:hypothetical protein